MECKVPTELETKELKGTFANVEPIKEVTFAPQVGEVFLEINFMNNPTCPAAILGVRKIEGKQICDFETAESLGTEEDVLCAETASALTFEKGAKVKVRMEALIKQVNNPLVWDIVLG